MKSLEAYFERIGVGWRPEGVVRTDLAGLSLIMEAHSRAIAFENVDVVVGKTISMTPDDVEAKLVHARRGGYCFEQNTLLRLALEAIGFSVTPILCRVRWNKPDDSDGPNTAFTHMALKVSLDQGDYLADVGFAGTNSMSPVALGSAEPQALPEGQFRVVEGRPGYMALEILSKGEWRALYTFRNEAAAVVDQECANWFSCTYPKARFTTSFFVCRVIGNERHHILNDEYVVRKGHGVESSLDKRTVANRDDLLALLRDVFGIIFDADMNLDGVDRYLTKA